MASHVHETFLAETETRGYYVSTVSRPGPHLWTDDDTRTVSAIDALNIWKKYVNVQNVFKE